MRIEEVWRELEAEAADGTSGAWLFRFALPDARNALLVALEAASVTRALLLPVSSESVPPRREWPRCNGLELFAVQIDGRPHLGVRLLDQNYRDVFAALAEDIAPRLAATAGEHPAARTLLDRLRRWQRFLAAGSESMSLMRQRGLFGELHLLRHVLAPAMGIETAVAGWRAALASHQDFQFARGAIEVKTTTAKQPQEIRITSERQLDGTGTPALFLFVTVLDERVVEPEEAAGGGEALPDIVSALRALMSVGTVARDTLDDRLLEAGYLDSEASQYEERRYAVRMEFCFHVRQGFPRLLEKDLPSGIGDVSYLLSIAACSPYATTVPSMLSTIQEDLPGQN
jgi:hypothetical protein